MRKSLFILIIILFFLSLLQLKGQNPLWTDGTAFTISKKHLELSLFRQGKYGITKKDQISIHPLAFFVMPHVFYKRRWAKFKLFNQKFLFSSRHGVYYPHYALRINNLLPFNFTEALPTGLSVPHTLALQNEVLVSHYLQEPSHCYAGDRLLTLRLGFKYSFKFTSGQQALIYKPILYRETSVLSPAFIWYLGADIDGHLNAMFNYFADLDFYSQGYVENWSVESKMGIMGYRNKKISGFAGIKMAYSKNPTGNKFLIMPIAGASYHIDMRMRRKHGTDLFKNNIFKHDKGLERDDDYYDKLEEREALSDTIPRN